MSIKNTFNDVKGLFDKELRGLSARSLGVRFVFLSYMILILPLALISLVYQYAGLLGDILSPQISKPLLWSLDKLNDYEAERKQLDRDNSP